MYPTKKPTAVEETYARDIMNMVNASTMFSPEGLVAALSQEHRTIQQGFTKIVVAWIEYLANLEPGEYDGRNEASVQLAKQLVLSPNWERLKYLPYI